MKRVLKIFITLSFLLALNSFMYAHENQGYENGMNQEMVNSQPGMGTNCIARYNFLTGILNVPCVDAGGEIYWINLRLVQENDRISLELVDAGRNDNYTANYEGQIGNQGMMNDDEMMDNQEMNRDMMDNDEMMNNQRMDNGTMNYNYNQYNQRMNYRNMRRNMR